MDQQEKAKEYLKDLNEWQNKMYSPGEYLGGKLPPLLKHGNRKFVKPYAWITLLFFGTVFVIALYLMARFFITGS